MKPPQGAAGYTIIRAQRTSGAGVGHFDDISCFLKDSSEVVTDSFDGRSLAFFYTAAPTNVEQSLNVSFHLGFDFLTYRYVIS
jgi:hypothetical protein